MKILNRLFAEVFYDNTQSQLDAETLNAAIDELNSKKLDADAPISLDSITIDTESFTGLLSSDDDNIQSAFDTLDKVDADVLPYDNSISNLIASNIRDAIDAMYQLFFPLLTSFNGGPADGDNLIYTLDGGDPFSSEPMFSVDGGDPLGTRIDGGTSS